MYQFAECATPVDRQGCSGIFPIQRRGGRAVECTGLENRQGCEPFVGSNPTLSAIILYIIQWVKYFCHTPCHTLLCAVYKLPDLLAESMAKRTTDHDVKHVVKPYRRLFIKKHKTVLYVLKSSRQKAWERSHVVN